MAVVTWDGSSSTSVATDANWDTGTAPDATSDVVIPNTSGLPNRPEIVADVTWNSLTIQANAEFAGNTSYTLTLDGEADGTGATTNGYAVHMAGNGAIGTDINLAITTGASTLLHLVAASGTVRNLTYNASGQECNGVGDTTINGDLTITAGLFTMYNNVDLTVGSLTIASGATYSATGGTTTITSRITATEYAWQNLGTFTHNNGTIKFAHPSGHSYVQESNFYDVEIDLGSAALESRWIDSSGSLMTVWGDLTITTGEFEPSAAGDAVTVHGNTYIGADGKFNNAGDQSGTLTFYGVVTNLGTFKTSTGTNNFNGGIRNLNDWGRSDAITIEGTGGILEGDLNAANINVNLDAIYTLETGSSSNYITATHTVPDTADFSISMWLRADPKTDLAYTYPMSNGAGGGGNGFGFFTDITGNYTRFEIKSAASASRPALYFVGSSSGAGTGSTNLGKNYINDGSWHHYAVTVDRSANIVGYFDGIQVSVTDCSGIDGNSIAGASTIKILDSSDKFAGAIADVRIFSDLLTADEIKVLASKINVDSTLGPGTANLTNHWKIAGDVDGTINDYGSGSDNGSVTGSLTTSYDAFTLTVQDGHSSGTNSDGTFTVTQGKVEGLGLSSVTFDGSADYIDLTSYPAITGAFTVAGWVYDTHADSADYSAFYSVNSEHIWFGVEEDNTNPFVRLHIGGGSDYIDTAAGTFTKNRWVHLIGTWDGTNGAIYIDGVKQAVTVNGTLNNPGSASAKIGTHDGNPTSQNQWTGKLKDIRIYQYALSSEQAGSLYSGQLPITPMHWWKLDEGYSLAAAANKGDGFADSGMWPDVGQEYTKLLIHSGRRRIGGIDSDGSATIADGRNGSIHSISVLGNTHHEADQHKFHGSSIHFDGTGDYLTVSSDADWDFGTGDFTIDTWFYTTTDVDAGYIIDFRDDSPSLPNEIALYRSGTNIIFYGQGATVLQTGVGGISNNTWHHVALVRSGTTVTLYIDGISKAYATDNSDYDAQTASVIHIGRRHTDSGHHTGYMDEFRILKGLAAWTANFIPPTKPYSGLAARGTSFVDASCVNADFRPSGGALTVATNGTFSAPRGNLNYGSSSAPVIGGTIEHNNGTFHFDRSGTCSWAMSNGVPQTWYDWTLKASTNSSINWNSGYDDALTLEGTLTIGSGCTFDIESGSEGRILTMGSSRARGTIANSGTLDCDCAGAGHITISGASASFPAVCTGTDWDWDHGSGGTGDVQIGNLDYQMAMVTGGGSAEVTLTGDCEFDAVTITANDTLNLGNNDYTSSGLTTVLGTMTCGSGAVSLGSGTTSAYGLNVGSGGTFTGGSGTHTIGSCNLQSSTTFSSGTTTIDSANGTTALWADTSFAHGSGTIAFTRNGDQTIAESGTDAPTRTFNNLIVNKAGGELTFVTDHKITCVVAGNLTITAGEFDTGPQDTPLTVTGSVDVASGGTFTMNDSTISMGSFNSVGTTVFSTGTTTITGAVDAVGHSGFVYYTASGNTTHPAPATLAYTGAGGKAWGIFSNASGKINNLTLTTSSSHSSDMSFMPTQGAYPVLIAGDLTINSGYPRASSNADGWDVTGDVIVGNGGANAALGPAKASITGDCSYGSLTINSNGTHVCSSGKTTIKGGLNNNGGTFTDNGGQIEMGGTGGILNASGVPNLIVNNDPVLTLDGSADYLTATTADFRTSDSNGVLTAWFKTSSSSTQMIFSAADTASQDYYQFFYIEEYLYCAHRDSGSTIYSVRTNTQWNDDSWHHVAFESNGSLIKIYVDGVNQTLVTNSGSNNGDWFGDMTDSKLDNITIGVSIRTGTEYYFNGSLADVRYYNANMDNFFDVVSSKIGATTVNDAAYMQHQWKLNSSTISTSGVGDDTGVATAIDLTPISIIAAQFLNWPFTTDIAPTLSGVDNLEVKSGLLNLNSRAYPHLDGSADYIETNTALQAELRTSHSISAWIKMDDGVNGNDAIFGTANASAEDRALLYQDSNGKASYYYVANGASAKYAVEDAASHVDGVNPWKHVVATMTYNAADSATMKIFVNGEERALNSTNNGAYVGDMGNYTSSDEAFIGADNNAGTARYHFDGGMRDVKFFDYALSADQVASLYRGSYNVTPLHWWKMDEGSGATATIEDYGTGTDSDGTGVSLAWINTNFTVDGAARIQANGGLT